MPKLFKDLGVQTDNIFFHCAQSTEASNKAIRLIGRSFPDLSNKRVEMPIHVFTGGTAEVKLTLTLDTGVRGRGGGELSALGLFN